MAEMIGLLLVGGRGTRLAPLTTSVNKHLLAVYDKPMIYYSLTTLILSGVERVIVVCNPEDELAFRRLLGDGEQFGCPIEYCIQDNPSGISHALKACESHWLGSRFVVSLGDNFFYGHGLSGKLADAVDRSQSIVFGCKVNDPEKFGVLEIDDEDRLVSIVEKPARAVSNIVATGLYVFNDSISDDLDRVALSSRGEYEVADLLNSLIQRNELELLQLGRGFTWLDMGSTEALSQASEFIRRVQELQGFLVGSPHEAAYQRGRTNSSHVLAQCEGKSGSYYDSLRHVFSG